MLLESTQSFSPPSLAGVGWISFRGGRYDVTEPVKPFATIDEQIDVLASRGLALDRGVAEQWLRSVGYYRLSGYWYPYREIGNPRREGRLDSFTPGVSFADVVQMYEFDRKPSSMTALSGSRSHYAVV